MATFKEEADRIAAGLTPLFYSGRAGHVVAHARLSSGVPTQLATAASEVFRMLLHNPAGGATLWMAGSSDVSLGQGFPVTPGLSLEICTARPDRIWLVADPAASGRPYFLWTELIREVG